MRSGVLFGFIAFATISRLMAPYVLGHPSNLAPIDAIALFSGAYCASRWRAMIIPLLSVWVGDWFVLTALHGKLEIFYPGFYWQYGTYMLLVLLGSSLRGKVNFGRVMTASLLAACIFFVISNFGVWAGGYMYPYTWNGLMACYTAGIPYFKYTLASDLLYSGMLFGAFEWMQNRYPVLTRKPIGLTR